MAGRNRGWRQWQRHLKMMRRLKERWNTYYEIPECSSRMDPKERARFADTPAHCSCPSCGNKRRHAKGKYRLTLRECRTAIGPGSNRGNPYAAAS